MKKILLSIILIVLFGSIIYSSYNIMLWFKDNKKNNDLIINIKEEVYKTDVDEKLDEEQDKIDFNKLIQINNETVGWIEIKENGINYPIVRHKDNSHYLNHSFDNTYNDAGWIFLDYRNNLNSLDKNNIIYAHGRIDGSMFGSLKYIYNEKYFSNDSHNIYIYTPTRNYIFEVFSFYHIKTTNDYLQTTFNNDKEFLDFISLLKKRSRYNFNVLLDANDKIITLSTCYNNSEKLVVHAKLIR